MHERRLLHIWHGLNEALRRRAQAACAHGRAQPKHHISGTVHRRMHSRPQCDARPQPARVQSCSPEQQQRPVRQPCPAFAADFGVLLHGALPTLAQQREPDKPPPDLSACVVCCGTGASTAGVRLTSRPRAARNPLHMPGGCWHSSGPAMPIRCHVASYKVPRCRPHGSPVASHRPSSRYVYSSWTPCLRTPLATGSCGIAKQGATAATCGTPGLFRPSLSASAWRSRASAGSGCAASPLAEATQVCGRCQGTHSQQQQPQSHYKSGGSRARVASGYAFTAAASSESLRERGRQERVARTRFYSYFLRNKNL